VSRRQPSVLERTDLRPTDVTRAELEDLLYQEAYLLDEWRMEEWLELWEPDAEYVVPTNDNPQADPENDLMYINHDFRLLKGLVVRLMSVHAHREYPWSKTRHIVTNVRVVGEDEEGLAHADAAFMVWRFRLKDRDCYVGRYEIRVRRTPSGLKLVRKWVTLDAWTLAPYGAVSIVL
jgi:p-cumate 2,3-dioxygenase beta subunit